MYCAACLLEGSSGAEFANLCKSQVAKGKKKRSVKRPAVVLHAAGYRCARVAQLAHWPYSAME